MASTAIPNASGVVDSITGHEAYQAGQNLGDAAIDKAVDKATESITRNLTTEKFKVVDEHGTVVEKTTAEQFAEEGLSTASIMQTVRIIGGAMIGISVLVVVLNQVFALDSISNSTGAFSGVIDSLQNTGVAALGLLVIGLLVLAANRVMGFFGGSF